MMLPVCIPVTWAALGRSYNAGILFVFQDPAWVPWGGRNEEGRLLKPQRLIQGDGAYTWLNQDISLFVFVAERWLTSECYINLVLN